MRTTCVATALVAVALAGCVPDDSPLMRPGQDCQSCHATLDDAWTVAGTVYATPTADENAGLEGVRVHLRDAAGRSLTLVANPAGNFFTKEALAFPLHVELEHDGRKVAMQSAVTSGSCNGCHTPGGTSGAPGRLAAPAAPTQN